ncbi:hypothetical protein C240_751 [Enterococcus sp. 5H]|nr:hypothetical protein [Enterococcus sp. 5H]
MNSVFSHYIQRPVFKQALHKIEKVKRKSKQNDQAKIKKTT